MGEPARLRNRRCQVQGTKDLASGEKKTAKTIGVGQVAPSNSRGTRAVRKRYDEE
jgi:hypothetical protein